MKMKAAILTVALGSTLTLAACGGADTSSKDDKMDDNKTAMTDKKDSMMKANAKISSMAMLSGEGQHKVSGNVTIKDNKLMLTDFVTDEGSDLHVYLAKGNDVKNGVEVSKIDLKDKTQTFDVSDKDLTKYDTVMIYCEKAHEVFGSGALSDKMDDTAMNMMTGNFAGAGKHKVSGMATIDGSDLKLINFKTDEGPDLHVYLTKDGDVKTGKEISKIDLKATEQSFSLAGVDAANYDTVTIYCEKAHEVFGQAPLNS